MDLGIWVAFGIGIIGVHYPLSLDLRLYCVFWTIQDKIDCILQSQAFVFRAKYWVRVKTSGLPILPWSQTVLTKFANSA